MRYVYNQQTVKHSLELCFQDYPLIAQIILDIHVHSGVSYLVGGAVRDLILGMSIKDLDIEVHNVPLQLLEKILQKYGKVNTVGKTFGVLRLGNSNIDWSVPRSDAAGRKPHVHIDPLMDLKKAFGRRDLTMNAMGIDLITYELIDPFSGLEDMHYGVLRSPDPARFIEDPLRFYRVMQFVTRFNMQPDEELTRLCSVMDVRHVSRERIEGECTKWLLQSKQPSRALNWLLQCGRLHEIFPEIAATHGVLQEPDWHPEGDVFEHTKQTVDAAALLEYDDEREKLIIMYAALCHDIGKATTTRLRKGRLTSYHHAQRGVSLARSLLKRVTNNESLLDAVERLVEAHLYPGMFISNNAGPDAYKRLACRIAPVVTLLMLSKVVLADRRGRNPIRERPLSGHDEIIALFLKKTEDAGVLTTVELPIVSGKDLLPEVSPGPMMGKLVKLAYTIQLREGIQDKLLLKKLVLERSKRK